jgi:hypothetical protein
MAITPSQWSHVLTIPESYTPSAATSGQALVITESVIAKLSAPDQLTFWANVQNGGGDVRICENDDGTNQLPVEVVSLDNVAQTCAIWTRKPTYNGTGNLYLFIGKAGETQPPVTDPFGRNAVWIGDLARIHLNDSVAQDSSGNNLNTSSFNLTQTQGKIGSAADFNGSTSYVDLGNQILPSGDFTISAWLNADTTSGFQGIVGTWLSSTSDRFYLGLSSGRYNWDSFSASTNIRGTALVGQWVYLELVKSGSVVRIYADGVQQGGDISDTGAPTQDFNTLIGALDNGSNYYLNAKLQGLRVADSALSPAVRETEYANQNDPAAFYGTPTIATTGGATGVTSDVTFTVNAPTVSASASATLPQPSSDVAFAVNTPTVTGDIAATLPQPSGNVAFTVNAPSVSANASATIPGYNASVSFTVNSPAVSADASATLPNPSANIVYTVNAPSISAGATASLPQPDSNIAFTVNTPSVNATASATQTGWNADASFTVNAPSVSISASATLPQPEAAVSFAVSPPQVAVVAIVGGIAIIVDDETNINQRVLSNNINAPVLSNNINAPILSNNING